MYLEEKTKGREPCGLNSKEEEGSTENWPIISDLKTHRPEQEMLQRLKDYYL